MTARPDYGWLSEESADVTRKTGGRARRAASSSIRSTARAPSSTGAISGACLIGVVEGETARLPAYLDCPALRERYWASAGRRRVQGRFAGSPSRSRVPARSLSSPRRPRRSRSSRRPFPQGYKRRGHIPSLAYRLAMVADGVAGRDTGQAAIARLGYRGCCRDPQRVRRAAYRDGRRGSEAERGGYRQAGPDGRIAAHARGNVRCCDGASIRLSTPRTCMKSHIREGYRSHG
jgi:hypothetical protein